MPEAPSAPERLVLSVQDTERQDQFRPLRSRNGRLLMRLVSDPTTAEIPASARRTVLPEGQTAVLLAADLSYNEKLRPLAAADQILETVIVGGLDGITAFTDHHARHEYGGADEIDVTDLSGLLADPQTPLAHNLLSVYHGDTTGAAVVRGDVLTGQGATAEWARLAITAPAATFMNYLGAANGDTEPGYKALFDATVPGTIAEGAAAAAGAATVAARRDHTHGAPATWAATAHNLLSAIHSDTLTGTVTAGDIIIGNSTPKWSRLAAGAQYGVLQMGAALPAWTLTPSGLTSLSATTVYAGTMTLASGSITDSGGAISFGNENLSTTGTLAAGETTVTGDINVTGDVDGVDISEEVPAARRNADWAWALAFFMAG